MNLWFGRLAVFPRLDALPASAEDPCGAEFQRLGTLATVTRRSAVPGFACVASGVECLRGPVFSQGENVEKSQPKKQSDVRGQGGQNVKGTTNTQAIRPNDQSVSPKNQPQQPGSKHASKKLSGEKS